MPKIRINLEIFLPFLGFRCNFGPWVHNWRPMACYRIVHFILFEGWDKVDPTTVQIVLNNPTEIIVSPFVLKNLTKIKTMSAVIGKLVNPASYKQQWLKTCSRAYARYHPTTRDNR